MDNKDIIAAKLAEWDLHLTDTELEQLVPAYENLIRWQGTVEDMLRSRNIADGMQFPESEPIFIHTFGKKGGAE